MEVPTQIDDISLDLEGFSQLSAANALPSLGSQSGPAGPGRGGNTRPPDRRCSTAKGWCFTWNNYPENWEELFQNTFGPGGPGGPRVCKWVAGQEVGENGTPHIQGYILFRDRVRPLSFFPGEHDWGRKCHWEAAKGSPQDNYRYCTKDNRFIASGFPKPVRTITELRPWQSRIVELIKTEPDERKIYWYWEETGNVGKTALCKYLHVHHNAIFCASGKEGDILYHIMNSGIAERDPGIVIYDIPRSHQGHISYSALEQVKNGMVFSPKYESGSLVFNPPHIVIFANFPPVFPERLSADRWVITKLENLLLIM